MLFLLHENWLFWFVIHPLLTICRRISPRAARSRTSPCVSGSRTQFQTASTSAQTDRRASDSNDRRRTAETPDRPSANANQRWNLNEKKNRQSRIYYSTFRLVTKRLVHRQVGLHDKHGSPRDARLFKNVTSSSVQNAVNSTDGHFGALQVREKETSLIF